MSKHKKIWTALMLLVSLLVSVYFCFAIWNEGKQIQDGVLVQENETYKVLSIQEENS